MGIVIFNNVSSADYGILVEHPPGYQIPQRDYEKVHIPGRNGDLVIDSESYQNAPRSYDIAFGNLEKKFAPMANMVSEWLNSASGYARLEDSYEPEYYRLALYQESANIENILFHAGRATINFDCKPQRFLKSGDNLIEINSSVTLRNPTNFKSKPIIKVYGTGAGGFSIGNCNVEITDIPDYLTIDSEIGDVYKDTQNCNRLVSFGNKGFPMFDKGESVIGFTGGITKMEVVPKWWTI